MLIVWKGMLSYLDQEISFLWSKNMISFVFTFLNYNSLDNIKDTFKHCLVLRVYIVSKYQSRIVLKRESILKTFSLMSIFISDESQTKLILRLQNTLLGNWIFCFRPCCRWLKIFSRQLKSFKMLSRELCHKHNNCLIAKDVLFTWLTPRLKATRLVT